MLRSGIVIGAVVLAAASATLFPRITSDAHSRPKAKTVREEIRASAPRRPLRLLFLHHSVGTQLLADPGSSETATTHPNGGGLRRLLAASNYVLHEATYGSPLGEKTDLFDWPDKFSKQMDAVLTTADGSTALPSGARHDVVMFKSCYPNNAFSERGTPGGNPRGPELTVENAKAMLRGLLPEFRKHPETLFVYVTTPPLKSKSQPERLLKWALKSALGRPATKKLEEQAVLAREFNGWVVAPEGWLKGYPLRNVSVIDYYDMLTNHGDSNFLVHPTGGGTDSHPSTTGQRQAAPQVLAALNFAVARAGLDAPVSDEVAARAAQ